MKTSRLKSFLLTLGLLVALTLLIAQTALADSLVGLPGMADWTIAPPPVARILAQAAQPEQTDSQAAEFEQTQTERSPDNQESRDRQSTQENQNTTQDAASRPEEDAMPKNTQPKSPYNMDAIQDFDRALYGS